MAHAFRVLLLALALLTAAGPAAAQSDRAEIERFIRGIYAEYADATFVPGEAPRPGLPGEQIYTPAIIGEAERQIAEANRGVPEGQFEMPDGPAHGFGWLTTGNDHEDIVLDELTILNLTADRATVRVRFDNFEPVTLVMTLAKVAVGWRIADIDYGPQNGGTLRAMLGLGPVSVSPSAVAPRPGASVARPSASLGYSDSLPEPVKALLESMAVECETVGTGERGDLNPAVARVDLDRDGDDDYLVDHWYGCPGAFSYKGGTISASSVGATLFETGSDGTVSVAWQSEEVSDTETVFKNGVPYARILRMCPPPGWDRETGIFAAWVECSGVLTRSAGGWSLGPPPDGDGAEAARALVGRMGLDCLVRSAEQVHLALPGTTAAPRYRVICSDGLAYVLAERDRPRQYAAFSCDRLRDTDQKCEGIDWARYDVRMRQLMEIAFPTCEIGPFSFVSSDRRDDGELYELRCIRPGGGGMINYVFQARASDRS